MSGGIGHSSGPFIPFSTKFNKMKNSRYIIRDREAGNVIDSFDSLDEAKNELMKFEKTDKKEGTYTPDFYEICDSIEEIELQETIKEA